MPVPSTQSESTPQGESIAGAPKPNRAARRHPPEPETGPTDLPETALAKKRAAGVERVLRLPEVKVRTGLSRSTLYELIARHEFPRPFPISPRAVGFLESEIIGWIEDRAATRRTSAMPVGIADRAEQRTPERVKPRTKATA